MTPLNKLWDLRENVKFWQYKFDTSYPHNARETMEKLTLLLLLTFAIIIN